VKNKRGSTGEGCLEGEADRKGTVRWRRRILKTLHRSRLRRRRKRMKKKTGNSRALILERDDEAIKKTDKENGRNFFPTYIAERMGGTDLTITSEEGFRIPTAQGVERAKLRKPFFGIPQCSGEKKNLINVSVTTNFKKRFCIGEEKAGQEGGDSVWTIEKKREEGGNSGSLAKKLSRCHSGAND